MRREKKRYHVVRKNQADLKALLRALVSGYLLYLAWRLAGLGGSDPTFSPATGWLAGGVLGTAAAGFGRYSWRDYRRALRGAELTPEEEAELRQERGEE